MGVIRPGGSAAGEQVVLCRDDGTFAGTASKAVVHHDDTPLHLAFSCYVFAPDGALLVTRRARDKATFPGLRTNSCCGHPSPRESMSTAVRRRLGQELGVVVPGVSLVLPRFRYRATATDGTVEHELCPVYRAVVTDLDVLIDTAEVDEAWWMPWKEVVDGVLVPESPGRPADPWSPWAADQIAQLARLGPDPLAWGTADETLLPAAALP
ncbi:MAG: isopentenyl-diphosphate Delta-isomerase [Actinomycetota bacterium]|nr:isopentenyl-diphosphate Delta-isomerase [Actinomycetota bacterium]